jgi:stearoyl-CoA desaturase (delta-9 desaturase)
VNTEVPQRGKFEISWGAVPFVFVNVMALGALWTGFGWTEIWICLALFWIRMFWITAGYHRYFAHRSFKTSRVMQFVFAFMGATACQRGPLWWAGHHRNHHRYSDQPEDIHSPKHGFWWSHVGWLLTPRFNGTPTHRIKDLAKYPELRWLDRWFLLPPTLLGLTVLAVWGPAALFIGFFLSTAILLQATFLINSMAHIMGSRRYVTNDTSRNSLILALLTCGEGWHNNHHYHQSSVRQGFYWWEIDISYMILKVFQWFGLIWDLKVPSKEMMESNRVDSGTWDKGNFGKRSIGRKVHS